MSAALKLRAIPEGMRTLDPEAFARVHGVGRDIAVAKLREFADALEAGDLDGCRVQWCDSHGPESEMVTVSITPRVDDEWRVGRVQMLTTKIDEV